MELMDVRKSALTHWLTKQCAISSPKLTLLKGDASSRQYYRLWHEEKTFIVMDAPPAEHDISVFIAVANALIKQQVRAPFVFASDIGQGFLLLEDFGDKTYLSCLNEGNADQLYQQALQALISMQKIEAVANHTLMHFDEEWLWREWAWHKEWFLQKGLGLSCEGVEKQLDEAYASVVSVVTSQPRAFMHRDYHSANLMLLPNNSVGVLDFQDAFLGPITYDAASLLRDCYIDWSREKVVQWLADYYDLLINNNLLVDVTFETMLKWFDFMSVQRHLKALLTFSRKAVRDGDNAYLKHIPRTINYILNESAVYTELRFLHDYYASDVQEKLVSGVSLCVQ